MGPYCRFCDHRCFIPFPKGTPAHILESYGTSTIIATCAAGQRFEKRLTGYCLDNIRAALAHDGGDVSGVDDAAGRRK